jgi:orotidine-5'-phosphate decarboxylase
MEPRDRLIVALNTSSPEEALGWVERLAPAASFFKVGYPLYLRGGNRFVRDLKGRGLRVFLDLKLHDIPSVVAEAIRVASSLDVDLVTVHTTGGAEMLRVAEDAKEGSVKPGLLGVTVLTSLGEEEIRTSFGSRDSLSDVTVRLALKAKAAGLHGIVCSGREVSAIREACGPDLRTVVPGIRLPDEARGDQVRVFTPGDAIRAGADYLVVGRPITGSEAPGESLRRYLKSIEEAK